jgi:predicted O-methyltransferase YrrM
MSNEYQFTKDWFHWAPEVWQQLIPLLPERNSETGRAFLEVGSFEGRSTVWIAENMMQPEDYLTCIDTWEGGEEHGGEDMGTVEERFDHNIALIEGKLPDIHISKLKGASYYRLSEEVASNGTDDYDFIYIDGSHIAKDVLTDACMAWPLLKPKGLMVFDDYMWGNPRDALHRPKIAIDAFCNLFAEEAEIVHVGYQLVVRKKGE